MSAFRLRDAEAADAPAIAALHTANWRQRYVEVLRPEYLAGPIETERLALWTERLAAPAPDQELVIAEDESGALAGFTCLYHAADPRWGGFVDNLHSAGAVRGQGVGKALLREAARRIASRDADSGLWLWVFEKNTAARGFYAALGGLVIDRVASDWDQAPGQMRLRCHWPRAASLASA